MATISQLLGVLTNAYWRSKIKLIMQNCVLKCFFLTCAFFLKYSMLKSVFIFDFAAKINVNMKHVKSIMHGLFQNVFLTPHFR